MSQGPLEGLGDAKVDDLRHRFSLVGHHQDVGGLQVPVNDPFLVGVMNGGADMDVKLQPLIQRELMAGCVGRDRASSDELHHEVGSPSLGLTRIEHPGDVGVFHQRQGLTFGLKATNDLAGVHPRLEDFQRDHPLDGLDLLRPVDQAEAALAQFVDDAITVTNPTVVDQHGIAGTGRFPGISLRSANDGLIVADHRDDGGCV